MSGRSYSVYEVCRRQILSLALLETTAMHTEHPAIQMTRGHWAVGRDKRREVPPISFYYLHGCRIVTSCRNYSQVEETVSVSLASSIDGLVAKKEGPLAHSKQGACLPRKIKMKGLS